jgi:hypothetical protein
VKITVEVDEDAWRLFCTYASLLREKEGAAVTQGRLLSAVLLRLVLPRKEELIAEYKRRRLDKKLKKLQPFVHVSPDATASAVLGASPRTAATPSASGTA